jgi:hypothetical protein
VPLSEFGLPFALPWQALHVLVLLLFLLSFVSLTYIIGY